MAGENRKWTLEDLVDFEAANAASPKISSNARTAVISATRGLDGAAARRTGLRVWLDGVRGQSTTGRKFSTALSLVSGGLGLIALLAGISAMLGLLDAARGGVNVVIFLAALIGVQWLILIFAWIGWLFRRRVGEGFSLVQTIAGKLVKRLAGDGENRWWQNIMDGGGEARAAVLWRLARLAQGAGICFNLGIVLGLTGLVLVKHVGFFWETTTEGAMRTGLAKTVEIFAAPWTGFFPAAVPTGLVIDASRWLPGREETLAPGPTAWWLFLLMSTVIWGLLPRMILWFVAWRASNQALRKLDFQARHHRALWRELTGSARIESDEKPLDGVLVLDVGGSGLTAETMRPFLLQKLRVHPAAWHSVAVLDTGSEAEAASSLAAAPAGIVLLAEGWALSPARMKMLHEQVRMTASPETPIKFLIANVDAEGKPVAPSAEEIHEWERFVDSLRDPAAEVFFFA